ncbi:MAG TPA: MG2 domain-containing protein, partial [Acidobacteriota bacterium]|nr:MG2 domain-containing protein [Acidobacteriota bacterium]
MLARVVFLTLTISPFLSFEWLEAFSVSRFDPVGTVKQVRQVRAEFSSPMVPFGNPERLGDPFEVSCPANGRGRWLDPLTWVYEFDEVLPAGVECRFQLRQGITALDGTGFTGERPFAFNTGGPTVVYSVPSELSEIAEDAVFVLFLDGPADLSSVAAQVFLTMEGLAGTIPVVVEESGLREEILQSIYTRSHPEDHIVVVRPRQFLAPGRKVRLVWGAGVKAPSGLATQQDQVLDFTIRKEFTANFHCERENPGRGCIPLISMRLEFSAPVPEEHLRDARLLGPGDFERRPDKTDEPFLSTLEFSPPFPPETEFRLELPRGVRDDSGRPLVNADRFPLAVRTDRYPALVKFPAWFGVLESGEAAVLPVTVRWVETPMILHGKTVLQGVGLNGSVYRLPNNAPSLVLGWLQRLAGRRWEHRGTPVLADGLLPADRFELTRSPDSRAFEVVGIPLRKPGFYVVEIESRLLGEALLDPPGPAFVPAAALVTDLGVHFKWGVEQSLIWVTELGSGKPAAAVEVEVTDCSGKELWKGKTDSSGVAVPTTLPTLGEAPVCKYGRYGDGLLILARRGEDFSFSHSSWDDGIEPWRFQLPGVWDESLVAVHTVLDRTLLRAGETLHMKHILRRRSVEGFVSVPDEDRPEELIIRHVGSMERYILPLSWDEGGVAQTDWQVPEAAKLGSYRLIYRRQGDNGFREWAGVGFRVEEFRVPLMRGTLQVPPEPLAAPTEIPLTATVEYLSGGPAKALPVSLRYLFTPIEAGEFPNWDGYSFSGEDIREGLIRAGEQEEVEQSIPRTISATLDGSGGVTLPVPGPAPRHHPWLLQAELEFHDPNGVIQTVGWTKRIYPSSRLVGIKAAYQMSPDTNLQFDVAVIDLEGRGLPGVPVEVDVFKRNSFSHRKRLVGGFYAYDYGRETNRLGVVCEGTTDESGILHCEVTAPATGNLVLRALVSDEAGRVHRATKTIWVSGSPWRFEVEDSDRMTLVPENARYAPGEVARIQVQMPFQEATALVTVEREGVARWYVTSLRATEAYVEVPLLEQDVPNVFVSVLAVRGRVSGIPPTFFADLARPSYKLGIVELQVAEAGSRLKVKVEPEQTVYRVRETVRTRVQVTGADGRAAAGGEVAVAVVDEGLLELGPNGTWDVFSAMMGRRGYKVRTATAHMHVVGKRHFGQKAKPDGGGGGRVATRELFDTLVFWNA